jgi:hypothetical protein
MATAVTACAELGTDDFVFSNCIYWPGAPLQTG